MTNLTILEAFSQTLSATKKYVNNRIDGLASETYVNNAVAGLVDSAPEALNTLNKLASALGNDANFATTISDQIELKANKANPSFTGNVTVAGKVTVGTAPTANMDVATKQYVDNVVAAANYGPYSIRYNSENNRLEFIYTPTN